MHQSNHCTIGCDIGGTIISILAYAEFCWRCSGSHLHLINTSLRDVKLLWLLTLDSMYDFCTQKTTAILSKFSEFSNSYLICYALHLFVLHLAPAVSVLQLLKSGTLYLRLFECVPAMIPFAINSRPTTSSRPSNPLSASSLAPQIRLWLTIVRIYKLYLLTNF